MELELELPGGEQDEDVACGMTDDCRGLSFVKLAAGTGRWDGRQTRICDCVSLDPWEEEERVI